MKLFPLSGLAAAVLASIPVIPVAARTTAFDGNYAGQMTQTARGYGNGSMGGTPPCVSRRPVNMVIKAGAVTISYSNWGGDTIHYHGQVVDSTGRVDGWHLNGDGFRTPLMFGRIVEEGFSGWIVRDRGANECDYILNMRRSAG